MSSTGAFTAQLRVARDIPRVTVAQRSGTTLRNRTHALRDPFSLRLTPKGSRRARIAVRHPTARAVAPKVLDPDGCTSAGPVVRLGSRRAATTSIPLAPGSHLLASADGRTGLAWRALG